MKTIVQSLLVLLVFTLLCGGIYPVGVWVIGQAMWPKQANGSIVKDEKGQIIGSELIAQKFENDKYFFARPSAADYATIPSSASNLGPTSAALKEHIAKRRKDMADKHKTAAELVQDELLTSSASGLDPDLSVAGVRFQLSRVVKARSLSSSQEARLNEIIQTLTQKPQWGVLGEPRVNVLMLNLALDSLKPSS